MSPFVSRLLFACVLIIVPTALAADGPPLTDSQFHAAYCAGSHMAWEAAYGDVCLVAAGGWENECSEDMRQKNRLLASLAAEQSLDTAAAGAATVSGQADYKQCISEAASAAGLAQAAECRKHYSGQRLDTCIASAPAEPACEKLRQCDE